MPLWQEFPEFISFPPDLSRCCHHHPNHRHPFEHCLKVLDRRGTVLPSPKNCSIQNLVEEDKRANRKQLKAISARNKSLSQLFALAHLLLFIDKNGKYDDCPSLCEGYPLIIKNMTFDREVPGAILTANKMLVVHSENRRECDKESSSSFCNVVQRD